jgi:protein phosphatase
MKKLVAAAGTHPGLKRSNNEDSHFIHDGLGLFVVADGMGGAASGEVASRIVVETMSDYVRRYGHQPQADGDRYHFHDEHLSPKANTLIQAILLSNAVVYESAHENRQHQGMGSTVAALLQDGDRVLIANVGDSRIFRHRETVLERMTIDHRFSDDPQFKNVIDPNSTMMASMGNTLTRAMGIKEMVAPDLNIQTFQDGDIYLLCSDGLTDMVAEDVIGTVLGLDRALQQKVDDLIELALAGGGRDNITVVIVQCVTTGRLKGLLDRLTGS